MPNTDRRLILSGLVIAIAGAAHADPLTELIGKATAVTSGSGPAPAATSSSGSNGLPPSVTSTEGKAGLKQALSNGVIAAVTRVSQVNGYWGDGQIRIPLPRTLASVQTSLKGVGLSGPLDDLHERINHGAEMAAPKARRLFSRAISTMTIEDVSALLRGGDRAGTDYLRAKTGPQLDTLFHAPMKQALEGSGAIKMLRTIAGQQGMTGLLGADPTESLTRFAVTKGLDGLFYYIAIEEAAIRRDPIKQTTSLLRKVFSSL